MYWDVLQALKTASRERRAATVIQAHIRSHLVRQTLRRRHAAAALIQHHIRGFLQELRFAKTCQANLVLQVLRLAYHLAPRQQFAVSFLYRYIETLEKISEKLLDQWIKHYQLLQLRISLFLLCFRVLSASCKPHICEFILKLSRPLLDSE